MISVDKKDLEYMMHPIVSECLDKYKGGEGYFNELDGMIKNNETLMVLFLLYLLVGFEESIFPYIGFFNNCY